MIQPALGVLVSSASCVEGGDPSGLSEFPLFSDWSSPVIGSFVKLQLAVGRGCDALHCCFDAFWCARPPDLALPLAPFPFLFLLKIKHRKALMRCNGMLIICISAESVPRVLHLQGTFNYCMQVHHNPRFQLEA